METKTSPLVSLHFLMEAQIKSCHLTEVSGYLIIHLFAADL